MLEIKNNWQPSRRGREGQRDEEEEEEGPINFSSSRRREEEGEDSGDEGRLVIKE